MNLVWIALLLGVVEGVTEFLPVSSTGHLILLSNWLGFNGPGAKTFNVFIQLGAILALLALFRTRWAALFQRDDARFAGWRAWGLLACGTVPALILGKVLHDVIKAKLFESGTVAIGLLLGGLAMIGLEMRRGDARYRSLEDVDWRFALGVGLFQCLALWPGVSRSAATIVGGMVLGGSRKLSAEFSFLLAVPVMAAAAIYDLWQSRGVLMARDIGVFAAGFASAFVAAWLSVEWLLRFVERHTFIVFGLYRIALSLLVLALI